MSIEKKDSYNGVLKYKRMDPVFEILKIIGNYYGQELDAF